jgi:DNA repair protein RecN (Recombination protein N)
LRDPNTHVGYVDAFAGNGALLKNYEKALASFRSAERELVDFENRMAALKEKAELLRHRVDELERAAIRAGELGDLETKICLMENSERIFEALGHVHSTLDDDETGTVASLAQSVKRLERVADVDPRLGVFLSQLEEAELTLRDCADGLRSYVDDFEFDADRLRALQDRRAQLLDLERRYGLDADGLVRARDDWTRELESVTFEDDRRKTLSHRLDDALRKLQREADRLSASRKKSARELDERMTVELEALMITGARFRSDFAYEPNDAGPVRIGGARAAARPDGVDVVRFIVQTNPGESEGPVDEIASTGEISRISLALKKTIHADRDTRPILVFDELDAGVGADLGGVIAKKLLELSAAYQIICITHMPQIAAVGRHHLVVAKRSVKGRTFARVTPVAGDDRRREIARMLGGEKGSDKRVELAGEMLSAGEARNAAGGPEVGPKRGKKQKNVRP